MSRQNSSHEQSEGGPNSAAFLRHLNRHSRQREIKPLPDKRDAHDPESHIHRLRTPLLQQADNFRKQRRRDRNRKNEERKRKGRRSHGRFAEEKSERPCPQ